MKLTEYEDTKLTQERLHWLLNYNSETGKLTWNFHPKLKGKEVGWYEPTNGYRYVELDGKRYLVHRLIWFYVHGKFPVFNIDHINSIRNDNRLVNLRDIPQAENAKNTHKASKNSKSGLLGVSPNRNKWKAEIWVNYKRMNLGTFDTKEQAHAAYVDAKKRYHPTSFVRGV